MLDNPRPRLSPELQALYDRCETLSERRGLLALVDRAPELVRLATHADPEPSDQSDTD